MKKILDIFNDEVEFIIFLLLILYIIILSSASFVDSYTLNYAKIKYSPYNYSITSTTSTTIPIQIIINSEIIKKIKDCNAVSKSVAYQAGYDDACDYIRNILGIQNSKFASRPKLIQDTILYYKIPIYKNYIEFNTTINKVEYRDKNNELQNPYRIFRNNLTYVNITSIRVYM